MDAIFPGRGRDSARHLRIHLLRRFYEDVRRRARVEERRRRWLQRSHDIVARRIRSPRFEVVMIREDEMGTICRFVLQRPEIDDERHSGQRAIEAGRGR